MDSILTPAEIDLSAIKYGAVKTNNVGGKSIYISINGAPLIVQTPEMRCPFGLSKWDNKKDGGEEKETFKYDLLLGFDGMDKRDILSNLFKKIDGMDKKLKADGMDNSMNWLGKKITSDLVIDELYTPMIRHSRDKNTGEVTDKYPPTFKVTVPFRDGKFQCEAYDQNNAEVDLIGMNLQGARCMVIMQCTGIWVVGKKYGCSWKVLQMKVAPRSNIPKNAFRKIEDKLPEEEEVVKDSDDELEGGK
jgi:hypothetical protein